MKHSVIDWADDPQPSMDGCCFGIGLVGDDGSTELIGAGYTGPYEIWCHVTVPLTSAAVLRIIDPKSRITAHLGRRLKLRRHVGDGEHSIVIGELRSDATLAVKPGMILPSDERLILAA